MEPSFIILELLVAASECQSTPMSKVMPLAARIMVNLILLRAQIITALDAGQAGMGGPGQYWSGHNSGGSGAGSISFKEEDEYGMDLTQ